MSYVPNNPALFNAAVNGFVSGVYQLVDFKVLVASSVGLNLIRDRAKLFGQAVDSLVPPMSIDPSSAQLMFAVCESENAQRYSPFTEVEQFAGIATTIVAVWSAIEGVLYPVNVPAPVEVPLISGDQFTQSLLSPFFTSARTFDPTQYPPSIGPLSLTVRFLATLQNTAGATKTTVALYDVANAIIVNGTALDNSASPSQTLPENVVSPPLTIGSSPGDLQATSAMYEVRLAMVGGSPTMDISTCSSARLVITYE